MIRADGVRVSLGSQVDVADDLNATGYDIRRPGGPVGGHESDHRRYVQGDSQHLEVQSGQLTNLRRQRGQLVSAHIELGQSGQLTNLGRQRGQRLVR